MAYSGHFRIVDGELARADIPIRDVLSLNAMEVFVTALLPYTQGVFQKVSHTETKIIELPGVGSSGLPIRQSLKMFMRDLSTNKQRMLELPAPDYDIFDLVPQVGYRLKPEVGALLTQYFAALIGGNLEYEHGKLTGEPF